MQLLSPTLSLQLLKQNSSGSSLRSHNDPPPCPRFHLIHFSCELQDHPPLHYKATDRLHFQYYFNILPPILFSSRRQEPSIATLLTLLSVPQIPTQSTIRLLVSSAAAFWPSRRKTGPHLHDTHYHLSWSSFKLQDRHRSTLLASCQSFMPKPRRHPTDIFERHDG